MQSRSAPTPIFNYRKRQRQAVFADPSTQPSALNKQQSSSATSPGHVSGLLGASSAAGMAATSSGVAIGNRGITAPPLAPVDTNSRMFTPSARGRGRGTGGRAEQPNMAAHGMTPAATNSAPRQNIVTHRGGRTSASFTGRGGGAVAGGGIPNSRCSPAAVGQIPSRGRATSAPLAAAPPRGGQGQGQRGQGQGRGGRGQGQAGRGQGQAGTSYGSVGGGGQQFNPGQQVRRTSWGQTVASTPGPSRQNTVEESSVGGGGGGLGRKQPDTEDNSMRVLTLPISHLRRVMSLSLHNDVSPLMFVVFGIVDSATACDSSTSGKSFILRDESGSLNCVFCEIDRPMPRLHRGQWYRVVGVARPSWDKVQCLTLRPTTPQERQDLRAVTSRCTAHVNTLCRNAMEL